MRNTLATILGTCLLAGSTMASAVAQQPVRSAPPDPATVEKALQALRADLQSDRADVISKNISLSAPQAAKFWPMFDVYQKEQNVIMDEQLKGIQQYVDSYEKLDDAGALGLINAHFTRDERMNALRKKWMGEFQTVLGTKLAVRVMQIDRRLSMAHQMAFAAQIPLAR